MSLVFRLPPPPPPPMIPQAMDPKYAEAWQMASAYWYPWLKALYDHQRFLWGRVLAPGCGLKIDDDDRLAVNHDESTILCDETTGLYVDASAIDHGALAGLGDDDHPHYLKEKASGGVAAEVPEHTHAAAAEGGTVDHGVLTGRGDDDHPQYFLLAGAASDVEFAQMQALQFVVENRTSDPGSPVTGQMWLRTDL